MEYNRKSNFIMPTKANINKIVSNSSEPSKYNIKLILLSLLAVIIICFIIYIIICIIHFYTTDCYEKKSLLDYLIDYSENQPCIQETEPIPVLPVKLPPSQSPSRGLNISLSPKKEVFHIANQDYTYAQSKCKCESYGGRLATKMEIIDAYNNGAHWCSYGWSEKQNAYYPVQKNEWDKNKEINDRLNISDDAKQSINYCGIPGINGGFFENPELKFGVNCYGVKPKGQVNKIKDMNSNSTPPMNFCKLDNNYEASHKLDTDEISSFNYDKWNMN